MLERDPQAMARSGLENQDYRRNGALGFGPSILVGSEYRVCEFLLHGIGFRSSG